MNLSWEKVCRPKAWNSMTEDEKASVVLFMNKTSFSIEEVKVMLEEQRKYIAARFEGDVTLISNKVCNVRVLNSNEYELNLRLAIRLKELEDV